jgi:hypothetical protein
MRIIVPLLRNPNFVGRNAIFDELDSRLGLENGAQGRAALCGLGGIG